MSELQREERYVVVKLKDLDPVTRAGLLQHLDREKIRTRECVVVEPDWPIYDFVWDMVQRVSEGRSQILDEVISERDRMAEALRKIDADLEGRNFLESSSLRDTARSALKSLGEE